MKKSRLSRQGAAASSAAGSSPEREGLKTAFHRDAEIPHNSWASALGERTTAVDCTFPVVDYKSALKRYAVP
jgi:hypothetical protein